MASPINGHSTAHVLDPKLGEWNQAQAPNIDLKEWERQMTEEAIDDLLRDRWDGRSSQSRENLPKRPRNRRWKAPGVGFFGWKCRPKSWGGPRNPQNFKFRCETKW